MNNKSIRGIFSFVIFIIVIQSFFTGRMFNFSNILVVFVIIGALQWVLAYFQKNSSKNSSNSNKRVNAFMNNEEKPNYRQSTYKQKNQHECEYCGHMNDKNREYCENCGARILSY